MQRINQKLKFKKKNLGEKKILYRKLTYEVKEKILSWCVKIMVWYTFDVPCSPPKFHTFSLKNTNSLSVFSLPKKYPQPLLSGRTLLYVWISPKKSLPQKKKSLISLIFSFFFPIFPFKSNPQFQTPFQNLSRRVPLSLNSNGKFPYKSMKIFKLNNWMNK